MPPGENPLGPFGAQELLVNQESQGLSGKEFGQPGVVEAGDLLEDARLVYSALGHQDMEVRVEIDPVAEGLDGSNDSGPKLAARDRLKIARQGAKSRAAELPQKLPVVLEEEPQHLRDDKDNLAVGDIQKKLFSHPLAPLLKAFGMARRTEPAGPAGEHQEMLRTTVRTTDAGEPAVRVAAIEIALDHLLDDGSEVAVLLLEAALVFGQKAVEIMEQHPIKNSLLRMARTINSGHNRRSRIKKRASLPEARLPPMCAWKRAPGPSLFASESHQELTKVRMRRQQTLS